MKLSAITCVVLNEFPSILTLLFILGTFSQQDKRYFRLLEQNDECQTRELRNLFIHLLLLNYSPFAYIIKYDSKINTK